MYFNNFQHSRIISFGDIWIWYIRTGRHYSLDAFGNPSWQWKNLIVYRKFTYEKDVHNYTNMVEFGTCLVRYCQLDCHDLSSKGISIIISPSLSFTGWWFGCHQFYFPIYWESHHPDWRTHIFQRSGPGPPTSLTILLLMFHVLFAPTLLMRRSQNSEHCCRCQCSGALLGRWVGQLLKLG